MADHLLDLGWLGLVVDGRLLTLEYKFLTLNYSRQLFCPGLQVFEPDFVGPSNNYPLGLAQPRHRMQLGGVKVHLRDKMFATLPFRFCWCCGGERDG